MKRKKNERERYKTRRIEGDDSRMTIWLFSNMVPMSSTTASSFFGVSTRKLEKNDLIVGALMFPRLENVCNLKKR